MLQLYTIHLNASTGTKKYINRPILKLSFLYDHLFL